MRWRRAACRCRRSWRCARRCTATAGLPLLFRITPFSQPPGSTTGWRSAATQRFDDTRVMVCPALPRRCRSACCPQAHDSKPSIQKRTLTSSASFAARRWPAGRRMPQRLRHSPVPYQRHACCATADGEVLACAPVAHRGRSGRPVRRVHRAAGTRPGPVALALCAPAGAGARAGRARRPTCRWTRRTTRRARCTAGSASPTPTPTTTGPPTASRSAGEPLADVRRPTAPALRPRRGARSWPAPPRRWRPCPGCPGARSGWPGCRWQRRRCRRGCVSLAAITSK